VSESRDAALPHLEVEIRGLILDPVSNTPIVILKKPDENLFLPIWIGVFEANAIALQLEGVETPRPMTHDLLRAVIGSLGAQLDGIVVHTLVENTFHAKVRLPRGPRPRFPRGGGPGGATSGVARVADPGAARQVQDVARPRRWVLVPTGSRPPVGVERPDG
jgi:hypothetical protein